MTTEIHYYCDYCGEAFDNKEDCIAHERKHQSALASDIHFFRLEEDGALLELPKDARNIGGTLDNANLIFCKDADSWGALSDIFENNGYCPPSDYCGYESQFYIWDEAMSGWYDAGTRLITLTLALDTAKRMVGE